jgi:putative ABC transport system ATP-binding protein
VLRLSGVHKSYRTGKNELHVLKGIDLTIGPGEMVSIMGSSGSGKSTLLNIIGLLDRHDRGEYRLDGELVENLSESRAARFRSRVIGFVFQSFNLIDELTVYENIELPLLYSRRPAAERRSRVEQVMEQVGVSQRRDHYPPQLSGGQQQRVAVARAIVGQPIMILADEPTGNLDSTNGEEVMRLIEELHEAGTTVVMVTHSRTHADRAGRIIRLLDGRVVDGDAVPRSVVAP